MGVCVCGGGGGGLPQQPTDSREWMIRGGICIVAHLLFPLVAQLVLYSLSSGQRRRTTSVVVCQCMHAVDTLSNGINMVRIALAPAIPNDYVKRYNCRLPFGAYCSLTILRNPKLFQ